MTPLDTVIVRFVGAPPETMASIEQFCDAVCRELAHYSYGSDGVIAIGWADIHEAAGDLLDKDTATLTIEPYSEDGGMMILTVPQYELGSVLTSQSMFGVPPHPGDLEHEAKRLVERLAASAGRPVMHEFDYDVALSFASEQRDFVRNVHDALDDIGLRVFFDETKTADLWGRDGIEILTEVYGSRALFTLMFISKEYVEKAWPTVERRAALATLLQDPTQIRVLPVRFDEVEVPGMPASTFYVPAERHTPDSLAALVREKLRSSGFFTPATLDKPGRTQLQAQRVQFRAHVEDSADEAKVIYRIHNGSSAPITDAIVVVADPGNPECDPENQVGNTIEVIVGSVGVDETIEDSHSLKFRSDGPVYSDLTRLGGLIWTDQQGNHWYSSGATVRRKNLPPRLC